MLSSQQNGTLGNEASNDGPPQLTENVERLQRVGRRWPFTGPLLEETVKCEHFQRTAVQFLWFIQKQFRYIALLRGV